LARVSARRAKGKWVLTGVAIATASMLWDDRSIPRRFRRPAVAGGSGGGGSAGLQTLGHRHDAKSTILVEGPQQIRTPNSRSRQFRLLIIGYPIPFHVRCALEENTILFLFLP